MKTKRTPIITCPKCGAEYLPGEVYIPNSFLGQPKFVEREHNTGKLLDHDSGTMNTVEYFTCEHCNTDFKIMADVKFFCTTEDKYDFNSDYKTSLKKQYLFMKED